MNNSDASVSRECETISSRHCERSEAIHSSFARLDGLLRFARNDEGGEAGILHNIPDSSSSAFSINSSLTTTLLRGTIKIIVEAQAIEMKRIAAVSGSVEVE